MRITEVILIEKQRIKLEYTLHFDPRTFMQKRCRFVLLKADGKSSKSIVRKLSSAELTVNRLVNRYLESGMEGLRNIPGQGTRRKIDSNDTEAVQKAIEMDRLSVKKANETWGAGPGQESLQKHLQKFFISLGARFGRIVKRPQGQPSPQLYLYKKEKLQELECQVASGLIDLCFGDESHVCSEGYVPYGWTLPWEDVCIPSQKEKRLNIFGLITRDNVYHGFNTTGGITSEKVSDFLDKFSMTIDKETFVVLDNAKIHRSKLIKEMRHVWEKRGLYRFVLPPYSPPLNIAATLRRILKGKWIQPADYQSADSLFYAVNRALAALGTTSFVGFSKGA